MNTSKFLYLSRFLSARAAVSVLAVPLGLFVAPQSQAVIDAGQTAGLQSAEEGWIREADQAALDQQLTDASGAGVVIRWRPMTLTDYRGVEVPRAAERLIRWDRRSPDEVFANGFIPQIIEPPPNMADTPEALAAMNLLSYINENTPSIFTSTSRYQNRNNVPYVWAPRNIRSTYQYEIFAPGGIDVNASLGAANTHANQFEIAFPGGIRPEFIRLARRYGEDGRLVEIIANGGFDPGAAGEVSLPLGALPSVTCGSGTAWRAWTGANQTGTPAHDELRRREAEFPNYNEDMLAAGDYQEEGGSVGACSGSTWPQGNGSGPR